MASLEDEEQLRRLIAAFGDNELAARALAEGLRELNSATGKQTEDEKRREAAAKKSINALGALADSFITYNKEIYKGKSAAEATASSMDKLGEAAIAASAGLAILAPVSLPMKALIAGIGLLAAKLTQGGKEITLQTGTIYKSFQELAKVGATGADGMQSVFDGLMKVGLGTEKFADYIKLVTSNTDSLVLFSGTVDKGKQTFEDTMASMSDQQREQMERMVGDRTAQAEATMGYLKIQRLLTIGTKEQMNTSSAAVMRYVEETDKLTRITGINRAEQEKLVETAMRNEAFNAALQKIQRERGEDAYNQAINAAKIARMAGEETFMEFQDSLSGFVGNTEKSKNMFMASAGKNQEILSRFRSGEIKTTEQTVAAMKELFGALGESTTMYENQAEMMNFESAGLGKFYERQRAAFLASEKGALNLGDAQSELNKVLADPLTAKMAKAENDVRQTQIAQQQALNLGMGLAIEGMETAAESNRILAESALEAARALDKISKRRAEPKKSLTQAKKDLESATDTAAADAERAKQLEADKNATRADKERAKAKADSSAAAVAQAIRDQRESELAERNARQAEARRARAQKLMGKTPAAPTAPTAPAAGRAAPAAEGAAPTAPAAGGAAPAAAPPQGALMGQQPTAVGAAPPGAVPPTPAQRPQIEAIRKMIGEAESFGGNYNVVVGNGRKDFGLVNMTIDEVLQMQRKLISEGKNSAAGAYQVKFSTLSDAIAKLGLDRSQKFDKSTQDKIGDFLIMRRGFAQYAANPTPEGKERFLTNLASEWAGLPAGPDGKSRYAGVGDNKAKFSWEEALKKFGDGGIVRTPTIAQIGEKGPEAVIPLKGGAVPVRLDNVGPTFAGYNEYKGYNMGPMSTDLKALEQIAGKLGAYDAATKTITDPKVWKEILNSGMLMNYNLAGVETGTKMLGPDVGNIIGDRINEVIKNNQTDTGSAIAAVRQEFSDAMVKLIDYMKTQSSDPGVQAEMLATLREISRTNASAASASEKMLLYAQN